jgi:hypothetical protein
MPSWDNQYGTETHIGFYQGCPLSKSLRTSPFRYQVRKAREKVLKEKQEAGESAWKNWLQARLLSIMFDLAND